MPGKTALPINADRSGTTTSANPESPREEYIAQSRFVAVLAHLHLQVGGQPVDLVAVTTDKDQVAGLEPVALERPVILVIEEATARTPAYALRSRALRDVPTRGEVAGTASWCSPCSRL